MVQTAEVARKGRSFAD